MPRDQPPSIPYRLRSTRQAAKKAAPPSSRTSDASRATEALAIPHILSSVFAHLANRPGRHRSRGYGLGKVARVSKQWFMTAAPYLFARIELPYAINNYEDYYPVPWFLNNHLQAVGTPRQLMASPPRPSMSMQSMGLRVQGTVKEVDVAEHGKEECCYPPARGRTVMDVDTLLYRQPHNHIDCGYAASIRYKRLVLGPLQKLPDLHAMPAIYSTCKELVILLEFWYSPSTRRNNKQYKRLAKLAMPYDKITIVLVPPVPIERYNRYGEVVSPLGRPCEFLEQLGRMVSAIDCKKVPVHVHVPKAMISAWDLPKTVPPPTTEAKSAAAVVQAIFELSRYDMPPIERAKDLKGNKMIEHVSFSTPTYGTPPHLGGMVDKLLERISKQAFCRGPPPEGFGDGFGGDWGDGDSENSYGNSDIAEVDSEGEMMYGEDISSLEYDWREYRQPAPGHDPW